MRAREAGLEAEAAWALTGGDFTHARVIIGIVTGFSMARLLTGIAGLIQRHPHGTGAGLQLAWAAYLLLSVTHFWWFEFGVAPGGHWGFGLYLFTIVYAALFFFTCVILFPDPADAPEGFDAYFRTHGPLFYGLVVVLLATDAAFAAMKGAAHLRLLGPGYLLKVGLTAALALADAWVRPPRLHVAIAAAAIVMQIWWILRTLALGL